jgi:hypothetical protein
MPFSSHYGKNLICEWLAKSRIDIVSMIDFGAGAGYYGKIFKFYIPWARREAVEVFEPYIVKYELSLIYSKIYTQNASKMALPDADIAVCGDVIEHMTKDVATDFIKRIEAKYRHVIVSIPFGSYPQGASHGNEFESHLSEWSFDELCEIFKNFKIKEKYRNIAVFIKEL